MDTYYICNHCVTYDCHTYERVMAHECRESNDYYSAKSCQHNIWMYITYAIIVSHINHLCRVCDTCVLLLQCITLCTLLLCILLLQCIMSDTCVTYASHVSHMNTNRTWHVTYAHDDASSTLIYIHMYTYRYIYIYAYVIISIYMYIYIYARMYVHICVHVYKYV